MVTGSRQRSARVRHGCSTGCFSKPIEGYIQYTQDVTALKRGHDRGITVHPGQDIEYVVVDDEKSSRDRVALAHECIETYDASYYETQLVRAVESVLSPLGWNRRDIRQRLAETRNAELSEFVPLERG